LLTIAQQGKPECFQVKSRKYAVHNLPKWKPNPVKVMAIINEFREDQDVKQAMREILVLQQLWQFLAQLKDGGQRQAFESLLHAYLKTAGSKKNS
jgi:hypothetical protein